MFLRNKKRDLKNALEIEKINRILEQYVDNSELYYWTEFQKEHVEFIEHLEDDTLLLKFENPLEEERIKIFTTVSERYLEFFLEKISEGGKKNPANSYNMRLLNCFLALTKRRHERVYFPGRQPEVNNLAVMKINETEKDFEKSLSIKMIVDEFVDKIENVDYKKVFYKGDKDLLPDIQYVIKSGNILDIRDMSNTEEFFVKNEDFFNKSSSISIKEDIQKQIEKNRANYKSVFVRPIEYHPLVGDKFTFGYLRLATKERVIDESDIENVDKFLLDISGNIRHGNTVVSKAKVKIFDISKGGARLDIRDEELIKKIVNLDVVIFNMNLKKNQSLRVSGNIVYIYENTDGYYYIGVDFEGSRFGDKLKNVIPIHVRHYIRQNPE